MQDKYRNHKEVILNTTHIKGLRGELSFSSFSWGSNTWHTASVNNSQLLNTVYTIEKKKKKHIQAECHNNYASLSVLPERDEWWSQCRQNALNIATALCKNRQALQSNWGSTWPSHLTEGKTLSGLKIMCNGDTAIFIFIFIKYHCI